MYSPAAMLNAPARSPATPASRMKLGFFDAAPATPMTSDRLLTRPSLTPKMTARNVPDCPARCQPSRRAMSAGVARAASGDVAGRDATEAAAACGPDPFDGTAAVGIGAG